MKATKLAVAGTMLIAALAGLVAAPTAAADIGNCVEEEKPAVLGGNQHPESCVVECNPVTGTDPFECRP